MRLSPVFLILTRIRAAFGEWLAVEYRELVSARQENQLSRKSAREKEDGAFDSDRIYGISGLEEKYAAAMRLFEERLGGELPEDYHDKLGPHLRFVYGHRIDRTSNVDLISSAIAAALREGATVAEAADAGAASVGLGNCS